MLVDAGANVHAPNKNGDLPIHLVVEDIELVNLLKSYGADPLATGELVNLLNGSVHESD